MINRQITESIRSLLLQSFRSNAPGHRTSGKNIVVYAGDDGQVRSVAEIESWRHLGRL